MSGFSNTAPGPLAKGAAASGATAPPAVERAEFAVAGIIGSELSGPVATMKQVVQEFDRTRKISRHQMAMLREAIDHAHRVAKQSQQLARLAGGRLRQSHERLGVHELLEAALRERAEAFQLAGVEVYRNIKPVEVIVDPGLLSSLIDAALDWALDRGLRLVISLDIKNWPEHGILMVKASQTVAAGGHHSEAEADGDTIGWHLLSQIAQAMGVTLDRVTGAGEGMVMIEFPRTVRHLEGLTAVEVDLGGESSFHTESKPLAGMRILLVTSDDALSANVKLLCRTMGLVLDAVPTTRQAERFCELDRPHMILVDERLHDDRVDLLRRDLHATDPNFPFVEIADASNTLEMAGWTSDSITRVSRDSLRDQLPTILVFELAKVS
ncbi:MAG: hypothetical protein ABW051_11680 [Burkholderiaceae bacterium]